MTTNPLSTNSGYEKGINISNYVFLGIAVVGLGVSTYVVLTNEGLWPFYYAMIVTILAQLGFLATDMVLAKKIASKHISQRIIFGIASTLKNIILAAGCIPFVQLLAWLVGFFGALPIVIAYIVLAILANLKSAE